MNIFAFQHRMEAIGASTWAMPILFEPSPDRPSVASTEGLNLASPVSVFTYDLGVDPSSIMSSLSAPSVSASRYVPPAATDAAAAFGTSFSAADVPWALGSASALRPAPQSQILVRSDSVRSSISLSSGSASQGVSEDEKPRAGGKPAPKRGPRKMTDKRRAQNRDAQRNLRARRQAEAGEHRERVQRLERENTELRTLIDALRDENSRLRVQIPLSALPSHLTFSCAGSDSLPRASSALGDLSSIAPHSEETRTN